ncbi:MAG TPA: zf-HC2 domain-containing protein [Terracidiphilus sp.]|jgi:anti-sigma factor RsiW
MNCEIWRGQLDAYLDDALPAQESSRMVEHLRACPDCAADAFERTRLRRATRAAAMRFTPSTEFRRQIEKSISPRRAPLAFLWKPSLALALAVVLAVAVSATMMLRHSAREQAMAQLVDLHVAALASPNPVDVVSTDRHTVKPWFQGKLPFSFNLPELEGSPYTLSGGKLVYFDHQPAAQLLFALHKHALSVFIIQGDKNTRGGSALAGATENGFSIESWRNAGLHYTIVSDAAANDVHGLGELMRKAEHP